jgi:hypothetical protein
MNKKIFLFISLFLVAVISCAPTSSSRYREGSNEGQTTNLTVQDEQRLTREAILRPKARNFKNIFLIWA